MKLKKYEKKDEIRTLVIAPMHDRATVLSVNAVRNLKKWIDLENKKRMKTGTKLIKPTFLVGMEANRLSVFFNKRHDFDLVFYYGHGLEDRLGDFMMYLIPIVDKYNILSFSGCIMYAMACYSGIKLGKIAVEKGIRAYFGMTERYFGFLSSLDGKTLLDWYGLVNVIPIALMMGKTAREALDIYETRAVTLYTKYHEKSLKINQKFLFTNALHMNLYGDGEAKINITKSF